MKSAFLVLSGALVCCFWASAHAQNRFGEQSVGVQTPSGDASSLTAHSYGNFEDYKRDFMGRAARVYGENLTRQVLGSARLNERVLRLDRSQAEFTKMPWEYLDSALGGNRAQQGIAKRRQMLSPLSRAEDRYGVPASIVTAIWGIESSYGANVGNTDIVDALATLAFDGRRREFAQDQLLALVALVDRGDLKAGSIQGSWAGGMGHTQFIPKTWLEYGVDGDGDGRRDPFSAADALTSTAAYLGRSGWIAGAPVYYQVKLPASFDYRLIGSEKTLSQWRALGLVGQDRDLAGEWTARLWLPAGVNGPALLTTKNFDVLRVYNNSTNYALAVATLANRINGRVGIVADFPRHERPLSFDQARRLQATLTQMGYDTKGVDGVIGAGTRAAFARWQADNGRIPDGFISQASAQALLW